MKRILFVISHLYGGGAERALSNLVTHIPNDWEIDILLNNDKTETYPYRGRLISLDIENERRMKIGISIIPKDSNTLLCL